MRRIMAIVSSMIVNGDYAFHRRFFREVPEARDVRDEREGTFAPFARASLRPMATACLRLATFFADRPMRNAPFFIFRTALRTAVPAFLPYRAIFLCITVHYLCESRPLFSANICGKHASALLSGLHCIMPFQASGI